MKKADRIPALDLVKFILSILVVAIHVQPFSGNLEFYYNNCVARVADPLFFAISAYCLFTKLAANHWKGSVFFGYMKRLGLLYGGWCFLYIPRTIQMCVQETGAGEGKEIALLLIKKLLLSGPYGALWFLTALLLAMPLTYGIAKMGLLKWGMFLSFPFYLLTVLWMGYRTYAEGYPWIVTLAKTGENWFGWLANGLNYGWFFCCVGAVAAVQNAQIKNSTAPGEHDGTQLTETVHESRIRVRYVFLCAFFLALLAAECTFIRRRGCGISYGAMLTLVPVTYAILQLLVHTSWKEHSCYRHFQQLSVLVFVLHYGVMEGLQWTLSDIELWDGIYYGDLHVLPYCLVLLITFLLAEFMLRLSKHPGLRWLRFLY